MKLFLVLLPVVVSAQPSECYWQQRVDYEMNIDFDVDNHQFEGTQKLTYYNNSPDTLKQVFYHLYFNAFQPGSMMDERSLSVPDPDKRVGDRISHLNEKEIGYHKITSLLQDGKKTEFDISQTILQVNLARPLLPGDSTVFDMKFNSQVPVQIRRSGRHNAEGVDYTMTQWYPKLAAYDENGWHPNPYVGREFYADFGRFEININIRQDYVLGGTGVLQNESAKWEVTEEKGKLKYHSLLPNKKSIRSWKFIAENVHDFAWAADPDFIRTSYPGPDGLELNFFYLPGDWQARWDSLPEYTARFFELMNERFGKYDYPQFSVIQGGDGGMEYPMCTMLKGTGKFKGLFGVTVHEAAHNWYYGMLATDEFQYPWMDEGFTSYAEEEILNIIWGENRENPHLGSFAAHNFLAQKAAEGEFEPLSTPADYFARNRTYGINSYSRGQLFLVQLRYIVGEEAFNRTMLRFYDEWKFKHPDPWDFLRIAERESDMQLDWYLNFWMNTTKTIDYSVKEVEVRGREGMIVTLGNLGEMPMPVEVTLELANGSKVIHYIPLVSMFGGKDDVTVHRHQPWPWTHREYVLRLPSYTKNDVKRIIIDEKGFTADVDRENNVWESGSGED